MSLSPIESAPIGSVASVQVGPIAPLGPKRVPSGFIKHAVLGPVHVGELGLAGDAQADLTVHGGPDKAVYGYAAGSYPLWQADFPALASLFISGGVGENLTLDGIDEDRICIGDLMRVGSAVLQVTQPRQPCFKFAARFDAPYLPRAMTRNGRSGWYYRVIEPGTLAAGDPITLVGRPNEAWSVARFNRMLATKQATADDLAELAEMAGLAANWQARARTALASVA
jgi:MOSC domain-containing protein YiiM